ncbi:MAG: hypothetical protein AB7L09_02910 [Nitrospira sp.]
MWDDEQEGTPEDDAVQGALIRELTDRCLRLLERAGDAAHHHSEWGHSQRCQVGDVSILLTSRFGLMVDVFIVGQSTIRGDRAYTQDTGAGGYLNRSRVRDHVLPYLRQVMLLDDVLDGIARPDLSTSGQEES